MTGIDSFTDPSKIGVLYPFPGSEIALAILGVVLWLAWHAIQVWKENREYRDALHLYRRVGMVRAVHFGGGADIATEEDIEKVEAAAKAAELAAGADEGKTDQV